MRFLRTAAFPLSPLTSKPAIAVLDYPPAIRLRRIASEFGAAKLHAIIVIVGMGNLSFVI